MLDDDLRQSALEDELDEELDDIDIDAFFEARGSSEDAGPFLGMSAFERMLPSIFFFMNGFGLGLAVLVVTDRSVF